MATFTAQCQKCSAGFEADYEWVGKEGECPSCGSLIDIMAPPSVIKANQGQQAKNEPLPKDTSSAPCPKGSDSIKVKINVAHRQHIPLANQRSGLESPSARNTEVSEDGQLHHDEKPCPFCGKAIKLEATFCKHCKTSLDNKSNSFSIILVILVIGVLLFIVCMIGWNSGSHGEHNKQWSQEEESRAIQAETKRLEKENEKLLWNNR